MVCIRNFEFRSVRRLLALGALACATLGTEAARLPDHNDEREEVIAAVECVVEDPGDLNGYLGIPRSALIRIETLSTYSSTLFVAKEAYFTGFPAVLNFRSRSKKFSFEGTEVSEEETTSVSIDIQGSLGSESQGEFLFHFKDPRQEVLGAATLKSCTRVK